MHALESEALHDFEHVAHPLLGVDIVVDVVAAAVGGGRVVTVDSGNADVPIIDMAPGGINTRFMWGGYPGFEMVPGQVDNPLMGDLM